MTYIIITNKQLLNLLHRIHFALYKASYTTAELQKL